MVAAAAVRHLVEFGETPLAHLEARALEAAAQAARLHRRTVVMPDRPIPEVEAAVLIHTLQAERAATAVQVS